MPFAKNDGINIYYTIDGSGPPLVFLHGGGANSTGWFQQIDFFRKRYTCICVDNRRFGRSYPTDRRTLEPKRYGEDVFAVMDRLGVDKAPLIAQSMGAWTATHMSLNKPGRVQALVTSSSPLGVFYIPTFIDVFRLFKSVEKDATGLEGVALSENFRDNEPEKFWLYLKIGEMNPPFLHSDEIGVTGKEIIRANFSLRFLKPKRALKKLKMPVLMMGGRHDRLVKPSTTTALSKMIPNVELEIFEDSGHSPYFEIPTQYNERVMRFLDKHWPV